MFQRTIISVIILVFPINFCFPAVPQPEQDNEQIVQSLQCEIAREIWSEQELTTREISQKIEKKVSDRIQILKLIEEGSRLSEIPE